MCYKCTIVGTVALMKYKGIIAIAISTLALAGCSTSNAVDNVDQVIEPLADTPWECVEWDTSGNDYGSCEFEFAPGMHGVHMTDDPELLAAVTFDERAVVESVVTGENWIFTCDIPLVAGDCEHLAGLLGGEMIEPGHWS